MSRLFFLSLAMTVVSSEVANGQGPTTPAERKEKPAAVPPKSDQDKARKLLRELFADEFSKKTPADAKRLSANLLAQARETRDDPAARFVLFQEARDAAVRAGELASALAIVEESGKEFAIRVTPEKQATLEAAAAPGGATSPRMVLEAAQAFAEDLRTKEEFPAAAEALKVAKTAATRLGNQSLTKAVLEREKELAIQRAEFDKSQAALKILESRP